MSDNDLIKFGSVELLSLYTTTVLKRLTTSDQSVEECLSRLIHVVEYNLNNIDIDRRWFFGTLKDHARLFKDEWRLDNMESPDRGMVPYDTLLLVVFLRLGVERLSMSYSNTIQINRVVEELTTLYHPKKPTLALKNLNQYHGLFDYLASHSPGLEEVYIPRSTIASFQSCIKYKNLRVLDLDGRVSDKILCVGLWNINKKSDKVLEMALKENKVINSWQLSLPHLEVLRNNFIDAQTHSMRVSLGAAALVIQPKMETVEVMASWDTPTAIMHLLDTEAKMKNFKKDDRTFKLTKLMIHYSEKIDSAWFQRLFTACPHLHELSLLESELVLSRFSMMIDHVRLLPLRKLVLDTANMMNMDLAAMLAAASNLTDLTLHTSPLDLAQYHDLPSGPLLYDSPSSNKNKMIRREELPSLESLTMNFAATEMNQETFESPEFGQEFKCVIQNFFSKFSSVTTLNLYNTSFLPASYVVIGAMEAALHGMHNLKHLTIIACNFLNLEEKEPDDDGDHRTDFIKQLYGPSHYARVRSLLPHLQREATFKYLCKLVSLELDALYLSPRVDRMVEALRASGVLVNIFKPSKMYPISNDCVFNRHGKKKRARMAKNSSEL